MSTHDEASRVMNRINLVFARYETMLCKVLRDETVPQHQREELTREGVVVEENFRKCRTLYEADEKVFLDVCGAKRDDNEILHDLLLCAVVS